MEKKKYFRFYKYFSTYTLKFFTTDIWCTPLHFINVVLIDSPIYLRPTFAWPSRDHRVITTLPSITSTTQFRLITWVSQTNYDTKMYKKGWSLKVVVCTAYGQTGSGKTFTMGTGFEMDTMPEQLGIIPR